MAKKLKHTIGTNFSAQFVIQAVDFAGVKTPKDLSTSDVYFELERAGLLIYAGNNTSGEVVITDAPNGVVTVAIDYTDLTADVGGEVDYGLKVVDNPGGAEARAEPIRGKMDLILDLVNVP